MSAMVACMSAIVQQTQTALNKHTPQLSQLAESCFRAQVPLPSKAYVYAWGPTLTNMQARLARTTAW